jgi:hypothetical protein
MADDDQDVPLIRGEDEDEVDNYGDIPDAAAIHPNDYRAPGEKIFGNVMMIPIVFGLTQIPEAPSMPLEIPSVPVERQIRSIDRSSMLSGQKGDTGSHSSNLEAVDWPPHTVPQGLHGYVLADHHQSALEHVARLLTPEPRPVSQTMRKELMQRFDLKNLMSSLPAAPSPPKLSPTIQLSRSSQGTTGVVKSVTQLAPEPGVMPSDNGLPYYGALRTVCNPEAKAHP